MGNLCSKVDSTVVEKTASPTKITPATTEKKKMTKIAIVYYSMYGHVATMAEAVAKGIKDAGAEVDIYQVPETLPEEVLTKMSAPPKNSSHPVIEDPAKLTEYDGIMFGISGRYGSYSAQIKVRVVLTYVVLSRNRLLCLFNLVSLALCRNIFRDRCFVFLMMLFDGLPPIVLSHPSHLSLPYLPTTNNISTTTAAVFFRPL